MIVSREVSVLAKVLAILVAWVGFSTAADAQGVVIPGATPAAVVTALKAQLLPQGFQFVRGDDKGALFALDRGIVQQQDQRVGAAHIVLEFSVRFKQKDDGLQVTAREEVVGNPRSSVQFRKPVESQAERNSMQRLLDAVRADIDAHGAADSTKRDSTPA